MKVQKKIPNREEILKNPQAILNFLALELYDYLTEDANEEEKNDIKSKIARITPQTTLSEILGKNYDSIQALEIRYRIAKYLEISENNLPRPEERRKNIYTLEECVNDIRKAAGYSNQS